MDILQPIPNINDYDEVLDFVITQPNVLAYYNYYYDNQFESGSFKKCNRQCISIYVIIENINVFEGVQLFIYNAIHHNANKKHEWQWNNVIPKNISYDDKEHSIYGVFNDDSYLIYINENTKIKLQELKENYKCNKKIRKMEIIDEIIDELQPVKNDKDSNLYKKYYYYDKVIFISSQHGDIENLIDFNPYKIKEIHIYDSYIKVEINEKKEILHELYEIIVIDHIINTVL